MSTYTQLRDLIVSGQVAAGSKVSETALAERLSVSRTPVREALQRLEGDGLVLSQGRGVRVLVRSGQDLEHIYRVRAVLEGLTAELAAARNRDGYVAPADMRAVEQAAMRADSATRAGDLDLAVVHNRAFHRDIAVMSANPTALEALERLWDQILISTRHSLTEPHRVDAVDAEHNVLLDCLRAGDPVEAAIAARHHVLATLGASESLEAPLSSGR